MIPNEITAPSVSINSQDGINKNKTPPTTLYLGGNRKFDVNFSSGTSHHYLDKKPLSQTEKSDGKFSSLPRLSLSPRIRKTATLPPPPSLLPSPAAIKHKATIKQIEPSNEVCGANELLSLKNTGGLERKSRKRVFAHTEIDSAAIKKIQDDIKKGLSLEELHKRYGKRRDSTTNQYFSEEYKDCYFSERFLNVMLICSDCSNSKQLKIEQKTTVLPSDYKMKLRQSIRP